MIRGHLIIERTLSATQAHVATEGLRRMYLRITADIRAWWLPSYYCAVGKP